MYHSLLLIDMVSNYHGNSYHHELYSSIIVDSIAFFNIACYKLIHIRMRFLLDTFSSISDGCEQDVTIIPSIPPNPLLEIRIEWPEVNIGEVAIVACPCGGADTTLKAQRYCGGQFTDGGQWEKGFVAPCNFTSYAREICKITQVCQICHNMLNK